MYVAIRRYPWLCLILLLYLVLALVYGRVVPLAESPDELDHFRYVQYLLAERRFPVMAPEPAANFTMEANQPPLYYLLAAATVAWVGDNEPLDLPLNACYTFDPHDLGRRTFYRHTAAEAFPYRGPYLAFHLARLFSTVLGAVTVVLAYALGRQLVPGDRWPAVGAAALLAFNPQFIFITASVNNDVLTACLGAATLLAMVRAGQPLQADRGRRLHQPTLLLALLLGLGLLTKYALLALWPLAFLAVLLGALRQAGATSLPRRSLAVGHRRLPLSSSLLRRLLLLLLVPAAIAGWWYARAYYLYGDPLVWAVHLEAKRDQVLRDGTLTAGDLVQFLVVHFQSYWLWLGWLKIKGPDWLYLLLALPALAAAAGLALLVKRLRHEQAQGQPSSSTLLLIILSIAAVYASLLRYIVTINWSGYQGRLAFTVAAPLAVMLATGLWALAGPRLVKGAGVALFFLAAATVPWLLAPAYPRPAIYQPPALFAQEQTAGYGELASGSGRVPDLLTGVSFSQACARFEAGLELEAVVAQATVRPGAELPVTFYGYGLTAVPEEQTAVVQIHGRDGVLIGRAEAPWTWQAGEVVSITLLVPVAADALPARALLQTGFQSTAGTWQPAATPGGHLLPAPLAPLTVKIQPAEVVVARPEIPHYAEFGDSLALLGYDVAQNDSALHLRFYWQALAPMAEEYTFFVHLLDGNGNLLDQYDGQPHGGAYPTSIWDSGEVVVEEVWLPPPAVPWQLATGVYRLETMARLPVRSGSRPPPADHILLAPPPPLAP
jgi:hypothetical protein